MWGKKCNWVSFPARAHFQVSVEGGHWAVSRSHTEVGSNAEPGGGWGVPSVLLGPRSAPPPNPRAPALSHRIRWVSNSVCFHLHDLQPTGSEASKNFWLRLWGSNGEGVLGHSDGTLFPPSASPHTKLAGRGGDRTPPPGSVGCQGPPARGAQPCVWFSHSRDQVWGPLWSFRDTASARPAQALLQASKAQEWAGVWTAAGETLRFLEETGGHSDSRRPFSPRGLPSPHPRDPCKDTAASPEAPKPKGCAWRRAVPDLGGG